MSAATACPRTGVLLSSRALAAGDDANDRDHLPSGRTAPPGRPLPAPGRPGHQHHPRPPEPSFGGRERSLRGSAWGQPLPRGSLRGLAAPSASSAFALPSSIHQGMEASPAGCSLGDIVQQTDNRCLGEADRPSSPPSPRASSPPSHSPPPSFRSWERPPQGVSLGASSNTQKTTAWGKHTRPCSPQPPPEHHLCPPTPLHHQSGGGSTPGVWVWGHHLTAREPLLASPGAFHAVLCQ